MKLFRRWAEILGSWTSLVDLKSVNSDGPSQRDLSVSSPLKMRLQEIIFFASPTAWSSYNEHAKTEPNYPKVSQGSFMLQTIPATQEEKS